jgi:hypothetical protein
MAYPVYPNGFVPAPVPASVYPQQAQVGSAPSFGSTTFQYSQTTTSSGPAPTVYQSVYPQVQQPAYTHVPVKGWAEIFGDDRRVKEIHSELTDLTREILERYYDAGPEMKTYYRKHPKQHKVPSATIINCDMSDNSTNINSFNNINSNNRSYNNYGTTNHSSRKEDSDASTRVLVGIIAVVVGAVTAFFLGRDIQKYKIASRGQELLDDLRDARAETKGHINDKDADASIAAGRKFFSKLNSDVKWSIATKAALVAACVMALVGAFFCPPLMIAGCALGGLSIMAIALNWGLQCGDDKYMARLAQRVVDPSRMAAAAA